MSKLHSSFSFAFAASATLCVILSGCVTLKPGTGHGHVDNSPCTWPYKALSGEARYATYYDEAGKVIQTELIATDSSMPAENPSDPHPHYFVHGRCVVNLVPSQDHACSNPTPFTCKAGNQVWCSATRC